MTDKKEVAASDDATTKAVKQLADWLLTEPNDGNPLCFAGAPEPTVLGLSRVKMRSVSGDEWTLIAGLHEGWLTAEERAANFFRIAKLEREEVEREEGAAQQEPDAKLEHARAEYWKSAHARAAKQLRKLHRSQHAAPSVPSVDSGVPVYQARARGTEQQWSDVNHNGFLAALAMRSMEARILYTAPTLPAQGLEALRDVIRCLRETGIYRDEEGESTNALENLVAGYSTDAEQQPVKCRTCNDQGMIGGPSYREPDEGGIPCPDCATVAPADQAGERDFDSWLVNEYGTVPDDTTAARMREAWNAALRTAPAGEAQPVGEIIRFADDTMFKVSWLRPPGPNGTKLYAGVAPAGAGKLTKAARDLLAERERQVSAEGWTPEHDDKHGTALAMAASQYAMNAAWPASSGEVPALWPWGREWWKPSTPRRNLEKAGALILAEMERIDRLAARTDGEAS